MQYLNLIVEILRIIIWPALIGFMVWLFRKRINEILEAYTKKIPEMIHFKADLKDGTFEAKYGQGGKAVEETAIFSGLSGPEIPQRLRSVFPNYYPSLEEENIDITNIAHRFFSSKDNRPFSTRAIEFAKELQLKHHIPPNVTFKSLINAAIVGRSEGGPEVIES